MTVQPAWVPKFDKFVCLPLPTIEVHVMLKVSTSLSWDPYGCRAGPPAPPRKQTRSWDCSTYLGLPGHHFRPILVGKPRAPGWSFMRMQHYFATATAKTEGPEIQQNVSYATLLHSETVELVSDVRRIVGLPPIPCPRGPNVFKNHKLPTVYPLPPAFPQRDRSRFLH